MSVWQIPRMWEGGECWIIGGGPSMPHEFGVPEDVIAGVLARKLPVSAYSPFLSPIHNKHVIGVNAAFLLGDWIDIVFFGDGGFYTSNLAELQNFPKAVVSCNPNIVKKASKFPGVKFTPQNQRHPKGISSVMNTVSWNLNSGAAAISLAYHLGVKRIYLLGFDMKLGENGNQHFHMHYFKTAKGRNRDVKKLPFHRHLPNFKMVANDARRFGLEIINVNPDSAIEDFPRVKLSDVL